VFAGKLDDFFMPTTNKRLCASSLVPLHASLRFFGGVEGSSAYPTPMEHPDRGILLQHGIQLMGKVVDPVAKLLEHLDKSIPYFTEH
jgi:hypothetical protein